MSLMVVGLGCAVAVLCKSVYFYFLLGVEKIKKFIFGKIFGYHSYRVAPFSSYIPQNPLDPHLTSLNTV